MFRRLVLVIALVASLGTVAAPAAQAAPAAAPCIEELRPFWC